MNHCISPTVSDSTWEGIFGKRDPLPAGRHRLFRCTVCNRQTLMGPVGLISGGRERTTCCWHCNADGRLPEYFGIKPVLPPDSSVKMLDINRSLEIPGCHIPLTDTDSLQQHHKGDLT